MLAESVSATKKGGQDLVGGLDVKVLRNRYGTQVESFIANLSLPFLAETESGTAAPVGATSGEKGVPTYRGVFIRAPVVEEVLAPADSSGGDPAVPDTMDRVEVLGVCRRPGASPETAPDIVAVRQRNVFGTSFHPELTDDTRIHAWWLRKVREATQEKTGIS
jgi:5'-phosphate synthase pdxT subunit